MSDYDLVVRGGTVATAVDVFPADVAISGERIAAIGQRRRADARRSTPPEGWFYRAGSTATATSSSSPPRG